MQKLLSILIALSFSTSVFAADNTVVLTPGTGVTMRTKDIGAGVQSPFNILGDTSGAAIYGTAGSANANVLSVQGIVSGTPLSVTVNNANSNGQATMANSSPIVIASNQTANALWGHGVTGAAVPANATYLGVNVGGNLTGLTPGTAGTAGSQVFSVQGIASMTPILANPGTAANWGVVATAAAPPANTLYVGGNGSGATGGLVRANIICDQHTFYTGSDNGSKTLVSGVSGRKTYICGFLLQTSTTATTLTLFKGTDADCATSGAAIGPPYALVANDRVGANSAFWNGFVTATNADYVCINASAGNPHTAEIWYAIL